MRIFKCVLFFTILIASKFATAQPTNDVIDPEQKYKAAQAFFYKGDYASAYPILKDLKNKYTEATADDYRYLSDDINCFYIICELRLNQSKAASDAIIFLERNHNPRLQQLMSFNLGHYYFNQSDYVKSIEYFGTAGFENLTNDQIADAKFEKAYALYVQEKYDEANPLFNEISQLVGSKYYTASFYYGGLISFKNKEYEKALQSFQKIEHSEAYNKEIAYYITEILYRQDKKMQALEYGDSVLRNNQDIQNDKNLKMLLGQLYFEKRNYEKSLPLLQYYVNQTEKVPKEILYELSFCYYKNNLNDKAIQGFRELSSERDSMGQNSMYLLGTLYLANQDKQNARNAFQFCAYNSSNKKQQEASRFIYAKLSYELGFQDIAISELRSFLLEYPDSEFSNEAKELMVNLLAMTNNFKEGLLFFNSISNPSPALQKVYVQLLYGNAVQLINDQQFYEADALLDKILAFPKPSALLPYARFWKAELAYKQQRYGESIWLFTAFIDAGVPSFGEATIFNAKYSLAYARFQLQQFKLAMNTFNNIYSSVGIESNPIQQDILLRMADCNYMSKDYAKANTQYDYYISRNFSQSDYALFQKAMIAGIKNNTEKIQLLNRICEAYPGTNVSIDAKMEIANTYFTDRDFSKAIPHIKNIINDTLAFRWWATAYLKLGLAYYNSNDNKNATETLTALVKKYPNSSETDEGLSILKEIYVEAGTPEDYFELLRVQHITVNIIEADSLSYAAAYRKYELNNYAEAHKAFVSYLTKFPNGNYYLEAHYYDAQSTIANKDYHEAIKSFQYLNIIGPNPYFDRATSALAGIYYFEIKNYDSAKKYFRSVYDNTNISETKLEALRGLVRTYYQLNDYASANELATELFHQKNISTDDKSIALLVMGKSQQQSSQLDSALISFKALSAINRSAWGAQGRYEMAVCQFQLNKFQLAESAAMLVIKETSSYDYWVTKSYLLLGDIFVKQKDFFNAKATFESVHKNSDNKELKEEALNKYNQAVTLEKQSSKITH